MRKTDVKKNIAAKALAVALASGLMLAKVHAEEVETEWISPQVGASETTIGARIRSIEELPNAGGQRVLIEIPRESFDHDDSIPEIVVTAQRPDQTETRLSIEHEWLADYDNDNYGLMLYLGKDGNLPLRIYFRHDPR
ncbi:MAG: hypothetical protein M0R02_14840 [Bacteroidales bacterium]|nr:hypothetical protein [Bacteroidales bacterium]